MIDPLNEDLVERNRRQRIPDSLRRPSKLHRIPSLTVEQLNPLNPISAKSCTTPECSCKRSVAEDNLTPAAIKAAKEKK